MENGYLVEIKGKWRVTAKFNKEMTGRETGIMVVGGKPMVVETDLPALTQQIDWSQQYMKFIKDAEVPTRGESKSGSYDLNKYSDDAMKTFRKMIEKEGIKYPILVKSTMLYYKTHQRYAFTLTRYITDGSWRSDYQALLDSSLDGTLETHIKQEIDNDREFNKFRLS